MSSAGVVPVRDLMKVKLEYSQAVLEGLVKEDFDMVSVAAQRIDRLSQAESWPVREAEEYRLFTTELRLSVQKLIDAAKGKNIDAATLAYFQMTYSCINCHSYLRGVQQASL